MKLCLTVRTSRQQINDFEVELTRKEAREKRHQQELRQVKDMSRIFPSQIQLEKKIAAGSFGEVWRGVYMESYAVAVKKMRQNLFLDGDDADSIDSAVLTQRTQQLFDKFEDREAFILSLCGLSASVAAPPRRYAPPTRPACCASQVQNFLHMTRHPRIVLFWGACSRSPPLARALA